MLWWALGITIFVVLALAVWLIAGAEDDNSFDENELKRLECLSQSVRRDNPHWIDKRMQKR